MELWIFCIVFVVIIVAIFARIFRHAKCRSTVRLDGKTTIVTGANTGIGKETAKDFASRGAIVVLACRDMNKGEKAAVEIRKATGNENVYVRKLDLASLKSVKDFAEQFLREFRDLHILVNNAGVMWCPYALTEDGFEQHFGVNHLGHFALTNLLLPRLKKTGKEFDEARVVNVSSVGHLIFERMNLDDLHWKNEKYDTFRAYGQSKLANILFAKELHRKVGNHGIFVYSLHPGTVVTELTRYWPLAKNVLNLLYPLLKFYVKSPEQGAQTSIYCSVEENLRKLSGEYFAECKVENFQRSRLSRDDGLAKKLWEKSEELTGVQFSL